MAGKMGEPGGLIADVNVTPLVDVMLVLLIIFMVTAPMIEEEDNEKRKVDMDLPVTKKNLNKIDPDKTDKMILEIDGTLVVRIKEEVIVDCSEALTKKEKERFEPCFDVVEKKLGANPKLQEDGEVYLLADTNIPYGFVVGMMARIKRSGVGKIGMITNPEYIVEEGAKGGKAK